MSPYRDGFQEGVKDQQGDRYDAATVAAFDQAEAHGEPCLSPDEESSFWLGYYYGRYCARTETLPQGLQDQMRDN